MRSRKRRLVEMLRAYRAAAAALPDAVVVVERNSQRVQWFNEAATHAARPASIRATSAPRSANACSRCRSSHWLAAGRNAEPLLDVASPVESGPARSACA